MLMLIEKRRSSVLHKMVNRGLGERSLVTSQKLKCEYPQTSEYPAWGVPGRSQDILRGPETL